MTGFRAMASLWKTLPAPYPSPLANSFSQGNSLYKSIQSSNLADYSHSEAKNAYSHAATSSADYNQALVAQLFF